MKKTPIINSEETREDELLPEYSFDYRQASPNRFALEEQQRVIILEPDVAEYFRDSATVNRILRALIDNMPHAI
jgi:hypothetical protein